MGSGLFVQIIIRGNPADYVSKVKYINKIDVKDINDITISVKNKNNLLSKQLSIFLNLILDNILFLLNTKYDLFCLLINNLFEVNEF